MDTIHLVVDKMTDQITISNLFVIIDIIYIIKQKQLTKSYLNDNLFVLNENA